MQVRAGFLGEADGVETRQLLDALTNYLGVVHPQWGAVFGGQPTLRELWRALPGLLRHSALPSALLWRRLSMVRSFALPVWQLVKPSGYLAALQAKGYEVEAPA